MITSVVAMLFVHECPRPEGGAGYRNDNTRGDRLPVAQSRPDRDDSDMRTPPTGTELQELVRTVRSLVEGMPVIAAILYSVKG